MDRGDGGQVKTTRALLAVALMDSLSYALILPALPFIVLSIGGGATIGGLIVGLHALCAAAAAPLLGRLSDRRGAKPVLVGTLIVAAVAYLLLSVANSVSLLILSRALSGAMAGNVGVVQAGLVQRTRRGTQARAMQLYTAAWALGFVLGPALAAIVPPAPGRPAGYLAIVAAAATVLTAIATAMYVTDPARDEEPATSAAAGGVTPRPLRRILLITAIVALSQTGLIAILGFFAYHLYGWDQKKVSLMLLACASTIVVVQVVVLPRLTRRVGSPAILSGALVLCATASLMVCLLPGVPGVALPAVAAVFVAIPAAQTALATLTSQLAGPDEQGAMLGMANGVAAIGRVMGPAMFGWAYASFSTVSPFGVVTLLTATAAVASLIGAAGRVSPVGSR